MKVLELKTKKIIEVNPGYGGRLIEQGMAVIPPFAEKKAALKAPAEEPAEGAPAKDAKGKKR